VSDGGHVWWEDAVVYEVYPRSFADADGDGVGDLRGLRSRLGYLADLGVDAIWLTPFYPSPLADGGYDVSDYCAVDHLLGTMADFDALVSGAAAHQIRVIIDLVPNHCSSAHPLFRAALAAAPGSDERARFIFRDGRGPGGGQPPNNWPSQFGGPAWTRVTEANGHPGQWYLHLYDASQPDWNWHNPDVPALFEDVIRFWLDRGVAGLRVDVAHGILKDPGLPDLTGPQPLNAPRRRPTGTGPNCNRSSGPGGPSWTPTRPRASPGRGPPSARSGTTCPRRSRRTSNPAACRRSSTSS
jgi:alpha-glucosidase